MISAFLNKYDKKYPNHIKKVIDKKDWTYMFKLNKIVKDEVMNQIS